MTDAPGAPRLSSTILLLRDGPTGLEVFMVVRHHEIDFASGALVFPGGRMEAADLALAARIEAYEAKDNRPHRALAGEPDPLVGFKVAAIREAFEECGVLLARPRGEDRIVPAERVSALDRNAPFADLMAREDLAPATDVLVPFARWITPAFLPKRYDTHFFLALAPPDQALAHDGRETVDSVWIAPSRARELHGERYRLLFPTERNLWKLARHANAASAIAAAKATRVVTVLPQWVEVDGGPGLGIPLEADYGGKTFSVKGLL